MSQTTASSDYFDDDPEFVKALAEVNIPELQGNPDVQAQGSFSTPSVGLNDLDLKPEKKRDISPLSPQAGAKRRRYRSPSSEGEYDGVQTTSHHNAIDFIDHDQGQSKSSYLSSDTYGASRFGDFGEYMHRKRQKLQIQNSAMDDSGPNSQSFNLFQGLQIYVSVDFTSCRWKTYQSLGLDQRMDRALCAGVAEDDCSIWRRIPCLLG